MSVRQITPSKVINLIAGKTSRICRMSVLCRAGRCNRCSRRRSCLVSSETGVSHREDARKLAVATVARRLPHGIISRHQSALGRQRRATASSSGARRRDRSGKMLPPCRCSPPHRLSAVAETGANHLRLPPRSVCVEPPLSSGVS
jgi:hypothetical protein